MPKGTNAQRNNQDLVSCFLINYKTCNTPMISEPAQKDNFNNISFFHLWKTIKYSIPFGHMGKEFQRLVLSADTIDMKELL